MHRNLIDQGQSPDGGLATDHGRTIRIGDGSFNGGGNRATVMAINIVDDLPTVGLESFRRVVNRVQSSAQSVPESLKELNNVVRALAKASGKRSSENVFEA